MSHNEFVKCPIILSMRSGLKVLILKCSCVTVKVENKNPVGINSMSENYQNHKYLKESIYKYLFIDDDKNA